MQSFRRDILNVIITLDDSFEEQINLENKFNKFYDSTKPKTSNKMGEKVLTYGSINEIPKGRHILLNTVQRRIFPLNPIQGRGIVKISAAKQMFQKLPIAVTQVRSGNTLNNLLNESWEIVFFLSRAIKITKKYIIVQIKKYRHHLIKWILNS